ncbi:MAG: type III polyketide synthase [Alphaproteobacteria bacterium]|nr:type III polyketide synthase [Alphaproteobacteria bacterium]
MQPRLLSLKSAVPRYVLSQDDVAERARRLFASRGDIDRLMPLFVNTGILTRHSCVPIDWYQSEHGWAERNRLYTDHAGLLLEEVARKLLEEASLEADEIDAIVAVSTTGVATPSLDAALAGKIGLREDIRRMPIFGLGCAGGVCGLSRAADLARANPDSKILFLVVELCALTFRPNDLSRSNLVAAALFGDGAAGAILSTKGTGPALGASAEYLWPQSLDIMGWEVENDGLRARFSRNIPDLVSRDFAAVVSRFLAQSDLACEDMGGFACHPGGAKVLDALERALGKQPGALRESRAVLRDFGNMSAATVLFVLERMSWRDSPQPILLSALGPGFTAAFQILDPA